MPHTDITNDLAFDLYARWEDEKARGNAVSLEELCAAHPELLADVREIADRLAAVATLFPTSPYGDAPPAGSPAVAEAQYPPDWREIGRGASSIVYRGEDPTFGTAVAFKVLHTQDRLLSPADVVRLMKRFEQEARILARLKHDSIVRIFKTFGLGGRPVLEMEYLPGGSLGTHLDEVRAGGAANVARFVERVARAVGFAHEHGIVHRDLKPSNILLDAAGLPCVSDFGVAKLIDPDDPGGRPERPAADTNVDAGPDTAALTASGRQPGTRAYMAPEQFDEAYGPISPATDVWALGVILYELLNGRRPFTAGTADEWAFAVCRGPLPERRWSGRRMEGRLEAIALRCLTRDPAKRYPSAQAVAAALEAVARPKWQITSLVGATPARAAAPRPRWRTAGAVAACAAALALAVHYWSAPTTPPADPDPAVLAAVERDALAAFQQCVDGKVSKGLFAFAALADRVPAGAPDLKAAIRANIAAWAGALATVDGLYTHPEPVSVVAASRDGRWVAVGDERGGVVLWDAAAGRPHKRLDGHARRVMSAAFSPDGRHLVTGGEDLTVRVWVVEGPPAPAVRVFPIGAWAFAVAFTPDGESVVTGTAYEKLAGVHFWSLATGERLATPQTARLVREFVTDAGGENLLALTTGYEADVWDLKERRYRGTLSVGGKAVRVPTAAYAPDGRTIATGGDGLYFWDAATLARRSVESRDEADVIGFAPTGAVAVRSGGVHRLWQPAANCFDPLPTPRTAVPELKAAGGRLIGVEDGRMVVRLRWPEATVCSVPVPRTCVAIRAVASGGGAFAAVMITPDATIDKGEPGQKDAGIQVWDMRHNLAVGSPIPTPGSMVTVLELDPDGRRLAYQLGVNLNRLPAERPVQLIDIPSGRPLGALSGHDGDVYCAKYLNSRSAWVTAGVDQRVRIWTPEGRAGGAIRLPGNVARMHAGPDERCLAVACGDGSVACLDLLPEAVEGKWVRHPGTLVADVMISPDGRHVVARGLDRRLHAWAVADGSPVPALGNAQDLTHVFPEARGAGWATLHLNGTVRWWPDLTAAAPNREWHLGEGNHGIGIDPAGRTLMTTTVDGKAQAWSVPTRLPVGPPVRHRDRVDHLAWGVGTVLTVSPKSVRAWSPVADGTALPADEHLGPWLTALTGTTATDLVSDGEWLKAQSAARTFREPKSKELAPFVPRPPGAP